MAKQTKTTEAQAATERVFNFDGMELRDPDPEMTPDAVRALYSATYPALNNATVTGPETVAGKQVFKFTREIGTKG